jgi:DHA2 family multidrug resistance protein
VLQIAFVPDVPRNPNAGARIDYLGILLIILSIGCTQIILDRGERADWFEATWVCVFAAVAFSATALLVVHELRHPVPIVDLRLFRIRSVAGGSVITALLFATLYANLVSLALYAQQIMRYPAWNTGLVMAPRGLATITAMFAVGILYGRIDARALAAAGLVLLALGSHELAALHPGVGMWNLVRPTLIHGLGLGLVFVPLSTLSLAYVPAERLNAASSLFNLMRNTGASFGIALGNAFVLRHSQLHQAELVTYLHATNAKVMATVTLTRDVLYRAGVDPTTAGERAWAILYGFVQGQAGSLAFNDLFRLLGISSLVILPLLLLLPNGKGVSGQVSTH